MITYDRTWSPVFLLETMLKRAQKHMFRSEDVVFSKVFLHV